MKIVTVLIGLLVYVSVVTSDDPTSISVSGTDTVPGGPPTSSDGTLVDATKTVTVHRDASSNAPPGQLLPTYCPYADKDFPSCGGWNGDTVSAATSDDCLRKCKNTVGCNRVLFNAGLGQCKLNTVSSSATICDVAGDLSNLQSAPGWTLFVRQVSGGDVTCPGGVSPTALPEDTFVSAHFCKFMGKSCSLDGAYLSKPKSDIFQCKTECNSQISCSAAILVIPKDSPSAPRTCYMFQSRCSFLVDDQPTDPTTTVTLYRMTAADYAVKKANPNDPNAGCPAGSQYYNLDPITYSDKFCIVSKSGFCPGTAGRMYSTLQNFGDATGCMNKCAAYPGCYASEFDLTRYNSGAANAKWACNMRDSLVANTCAPEDVVQSPGGNQGEVRIRLKPDANGNLKCPVGSTPSDSLVPWAAKFCITYDRVCPTSVAARSTVTATDLNDCLTKCRNTAGCQSAAFEGSFCTLIQGQCTSAQLQISMLKKYYTKVDLSATCPSIDCPPNSHPESGTSICPNTCANPQASSDCNIQTYRCVCDGDYLDLDGQCVKKDQCPNCAATAPAQPELVSDNDYTQVYRILAHTAAEVASAKQCGTGAVIKNKKPCPNTCANKTAQDNCPIQQSVPSCHCADPNQVYDAASHFCRDPGTCA